MSVNEKPPAGGVECEESVMNDLVILPLSGLQDRLRFLNGADLFSLIERADHLRRLRQVLQGWLKRARQEGLISPKDELPFSSKVVRVIAGGAESGNLERYLRMGPTGRPDRFFPRPSVPPRITRGPTP